MYERDYNVEQRKNVIPITVELDEITEKIYNWINEGYYRLYQLQLDKNRVDRLNSMGYIGHIDVNDIIPEP